MSEDNKKVADHTIDGERTEVYESRQGRPLVTVVHTISSKPRAVVLCPKEARIVALALLDFAERNGSK